MPNGSAGSFYKHVRVRSVRVYNPLFIAFSCAVSNWPVAVLLVVTSLLLSWTGQALFSFSASLREALWTNNFVNLDLSYFADLFVLVYDYDRYITFLIFAFFYFPSFIFLHAVRLSCFEQKGFHEIRPSWCAFSLEWPGLWTSGREEEEMKMPAKSWPCSASSSSQYSDVRIIV